MVIGIGGPNQFDGAVFGSNPLPSPAFEVELRSIRQESHPARRDADLLNLAQRLERQGDEGAALELYREIESHRGEAKGLARLAADRRETLLGHETPFSHQMEFQVRRFLRDCLNPAGLFAMGAAGAAFRITRFAMLGRLGVAGSGFWTRGPAASLLAGLVGFSAEAPAFVLSQRVAEEALGQRLEWNEDVLGRELASSFLMLGGLRLGSYFFGTALRRIHGESLPHPFLRGFYHQAGMFGGILLGQRWEEAAGLRPAHSGGAAIFAGLSTLLQFHVAGTALHRGLGPRFRSVQRDLQIRSATLPGPEGTTSPLRFAEAAGPGPERLRFIHLVWMTGDGDSSGGRRRSKVVYLDDYRRLRPEEASPQNRLSNTNPDWLPQIRSAMTVWLAETPLHPEREFQYLRERLQEHPASLTPLFGYLSIRHSLGARLLAIRLDLLRGNSWIRNSPQVQEAQQELARDRWLEEDLSDIYRQLGMRWEMIMQNSEGTATRGEISPRLFPFRRALENTPSELVTALNDHRLTSEQFLQLGHLLGFFPRP